MDLNSSMVRIKTENSLNMDVNVLRKPDELRLDGNVSENWKRFRKQLEIFMLAAGMTEKSSEEKSAIALNLIGGEAFELLDLLELEEVDQKSYEAVIEAYEKYCTPKKNIVYERFVFYTRIQKESEPFDQYYADVRKLAKNCEFIGGHAAVNELVRDRLVLGTAHTELQEQLIRMKDSSLENIVLRSKLYEKNNEHLREIQSGAADKKIDAIRRGNQQPKKLDTNNGKNGAHGSCGYCGYAHQKGRCAAFGKQCNKCKKLNHFESVCRSSVGVHDVETASKELGDQRDEFFIDSVTVVDNINVKNDSLQSWYEIIRIEDTNVRFKLDSGSEVNILPSRVYEKINGKMCKNLRATSVVLEAYGGFKIRPKGQINFVARYGDATNVFEFLIADGSIKPILGLRACVTLGIIARTGTSKATQVNSDNNIQQIDSVEKAKFVDEYADIFDGLGIIKTNQTLAVLPTAKPIAKPPRRIPAKVIDQVKQKIDELEAMGIVERVDEPSQWVHNLVVVEKPDGSVRLCLDPRELNNVLMDEFFMIPTLEEISEKIQGAEYYTVLDLKDGFYQIKLDENASKLCTFSTPFGCYKFNRFPFGLKMGPELCQKYNTEHFGHVKGTAIYLDDLLVTGKTKAEHDDALKAVVNVAREKKIKFNLRKLQYCQREIKYIGHIFSKDGVRNDPERIRAIEQMERPKNVKELQRFLGMVNYVRNFIPNMSGRTAKLRELLKKDVEWIWLQEHENAFKGMKSTLTSAPVLRIFDNSKKCTIQCDASKDGLGYCLLQEGKPVAYGSKSLTDAQKNYGQIEKEFLAILSACHRFHHYIYGREVIIQTDHKPLVSIIDKNLHDINSVRLQRIRIKLLKYRLRLVYVPGKDMHVADTLSRAFLSDETEYGSLNQIVHCVAVSDARRQEIIEATNLDEEMRELKKHFKLGWPTDKSKVNPIVHIYWNIRNNIYEEEGLIFFDHKIIIPARLRSILLQKTHEAGHFGINRTLNRAKEIMYWPGMAEQIIGVVSKCPVCAKFQRSNTKEPLLPHELPNAPFEKIGCDFCDFGGKSYLIVKDYFSKWLEIVETKTKTATEVINIWRTLFAVFGIPTTIVADNQPFNSYKCQLFANECETRLITSSPYYPRSNGMAEKAVKTAKAILRKTSESGKHHMTALMEYRNTPLPGVNLSPVQIMFGRQVRTSSLTPLQSTQNQYSERVKMLLAEAQKGMKQYYDQHAKSRPGFEANEKVLVQQQNRQWKLGKIVSSTAHPRSYIVRDQTGKLVRRNAINLRSARTMPSMPGNGHCSESDDEPLERADVDIGEGEGEGRDEGQDTSQGYDTATEVEEGQEVQLPVVPDAENRQTARRGRPFGVSRFGRVRSQPEYYGQ